MATDVSIIYVNYHTSELIIDSILSVIEKTAGVSYEIIIVDNNTEKDIDEKISKKLPHNISITSILLEENIGFGRANNEGLKKARGRNIFFLNPDTLLTNNAIKILSDFLDNNPKTGACGGNLINQAKIPTISFKRTLPGLFWDMDELLNTLPNKLFFGKNWLYNHSRKPLKVGFISGADLMVKREVINLTGGFSEDFFMYYEETDLCARIKKAGWEIYNVPSAQIIHLIGASNRNENTKHSEFETQYMEISRNIYYHKNIPTFSRVLSNFLYYIFLNSRKILIREPVKKEYYQKRLLYHLLSK